MTFEAKYHGRCGVCDEPIRPGDMAAYAEDVVVHADCPDVPAPTPLPICGKCFMETSVTGECGCDQ